MRRLHFDESHKVKFFFFCEGAGTHFFQTKSFTESTLGKMRNTTHSTTHNLQVHKVTQSTLKEIKFKETQRDLQLFVAARNPPSGAYRPSPLSFKESKGPAFVYSRRRCKGVFPTTKPSTKSPKQSNPSTNPQPETRVLTRKSNPHRARTSSIPNTKRTSTTTLIPPSLEMEETPEQTTAVLPATPESSP